MGVELEKDSEVDLQSLATPYEDYVEKGGILDSLSFWMLDNFTTLDTSLIAENSLNAARSRAESMALRAGVVLTQMEEEMYILLRTIKPGKSPVDNGQNPQILSD